MRMDISVALRALLSEVTHMHDTHRRCPLPTQCAPSTRQHILRHETTSQKSSCALHCSATIIVATTFQRISRLQTPHTLPAPTMLCLGLLTRPTGACSSRGSSVSFSSSTCDTQGHVASGSRSSCGGTPRPPRSARTYLLRILLQTTFLTCNTLFRHADFVSARPIGKRPKVRNGLRLILGRHGHRFLHGD